MTKLKNKNSDKTQKTQVVTKLKKTHSQNSKLKLLENLKVSNSNYKNKQQQKINCDKTLKIK